MEFDKRAVRMADDVLDREAATRGSVLEVASELGLGDVWWDAIHADGTRLLHARLCTDSIWLVKLRKHAQAHIIHELRYTCTEE